MAVDVMGQSGFVAWLFIWECVCTWEHTLHTYNDGNNVFYNCDRSSLHVSKVELAFLDFVFTPVNWFAMQELGCDLPYFELQCHASTVSLALLHFVYMHTVFLSLGLDIYPHGRN